MIHREEGRAAAAAAAACGLQTLVAELLQRSKANPGADRMTAPRAALLAALAEAARAGGDAILPIYETHVAQMRAGDVAQMRAGDVAQMRADAPPPSAAAAQDAVALREKPDGSPLTAADLAADAAIAAALARLCPGIPVVSEEGDARDAPARFLLVDPLDGTKEFLAGNGEFTVNIALIEDHEPVAGVVLAPALGVLWAGAAGQGATRTELAPRPGGPGAASAPHDPVSDKIRPVQVRPRPAAPVAVASRSHADAATEGFLARIGAGARRSVGSSLKFCLVAEGAADVYPRFAPTMEWDTAAGHAVLLAAGGRVEAPDGAPLRYGIAGRGWRNGQFIAWGGDLPGAA
jgi:3'(2'), 5'-bisphosphate nucleotidase